MGLKQETKQHVEQVAKESLNNFEMVASAAQEALRLPPPQSLGTDTLVNHLGWTSDSALPDRISSLRSMFVAKW